jgi:hypothetical protein
LAKPDFIKPDWPAPKNVQAFTSCRMGGFSRPPFDEFNIAQHVGDDTEIVEKNRQLLPNFQQFVWLNQIHSNICVELNQQTSRQHNLLQADACYTHTKQQVCAVMTADCLPILLCNKQGTSVAAVHAGWRGLADGIIENTVQGMHVEPTQLMAWIGPAISQANFEVGSDVKCAFEKYPQAFIKGQQTDKYLADLALIARVKLAALGINQVFGGDYCTYANENMFFSHRRTVHQTAENANIVATTGRMVSAIYLT